MKKIKLETLTPIVLNQEEKEKLNYQNYESVLNTIMETDEYCNVALTGPYGAGKSTILNTYEKEHKLKTIHISLGQLNNEKTENIQAKLINQIIHQIDSKRIPQTQFKIKKVVGKFKICLIAILLFLFITSFLYLLKVPQTQVIKNVNISLYDLFWLYRENIIVLKIALISFFILLLMIVAMQLRRPLIKSIHVDKSQIELVESENKEKDDKEKFDKYMDEIIYLFEKSKIDALVIEDLDRLEDVKIFYEFRQINYLLNKKLERKNKKIIRFIYMVRDELFKKSEERTKFFDIIVPIVPVMDNSNSYDLMKKMIGTEWLNILDASYLKTICLYIRDYRLLKNIFNEFQVYYHQLRIEDRQYKAMKLFAMVTYKNLWPKDFADLQQGKGNVFKALNGIDNLRKNMINKIENEIQDLYNEIQEMQDELPNNEDELDAIYFEESLNSDNSTDGYYTVDGKNEYDFDNRKEFIRAIKDAEKVEWCRRNYSRITVPKEKIEEIFARLNLDEEYATRKRRILEYYQNGTQNIEQLIAEKREEQKVIKEAGFKKLSAEGVPKGISKLFVGGNELIQIFLQDEMISTDYASYMTYFYPYSITNEELRYLNKVYARIDDDEQADIEITHSDLIIDYLKTGDWDSIALSNKMFYKHLVKQGGDNLEKAIKNLKKYSKVQFAIDMLQELDSDEDLYIWINKLLEEWNDFFTALIESKLWIDKEILRIMILMLKQIDDEKIPSTTIINFLKTVETELTNQCDSLIVEVLKKIDYKFFDLSQIPEEVWQDVYTNNLYEISRNNLEYVIKKQYQIDNEENILKQNFSLIVSDKEEAMAKYISSNLEEYMNEVYVPFYANNTEETGAIIGFINNEDLSIESRVKLISGMAVIVQNINEVTHVELRSEIVKHKKMAFINTNIISVWNDTQTITEEMNSFLKEKYSTGKCQLSFVFMKKYFQETNETHPNSSELASQLLNLDNLEGAYKNLVEDISIRYTSKTSVTWTEKQLKVIVKTRTIDMTEKNLILMRQLENEGLFYQWLSNKVGLYLKLMGKGELRNNDELQKLIAMESVVDNDKIGCIRICTQPIHIHEKYNTRVVEEIFENNLFDGDFIPIIRRYQSNRYGKQFKAKLGNYMVRYITHVINMRFWLPYELLSYIMKNNSVTSANKKQLLAAQVGYHSLESIKMCFELSNMSEYSDAFNGFNPKVEANEENRILIETLVKREWLSSFKAIEGKYMLYPKKSVLQKL